MFKRFALIAVLAALALPSTAQAYNCAIPALIDPVKKAVCSQVSLINMDHDEISRRTALTAKLALDARAIVSGDRRAFVQTRGQCGRDTRCLDATYRAQLRLYGRLDACTRRQGAQQSNCVTRTIQQHREELHRSL